MTETDNSPLETICSNDDASAQVRWRIVAGVILLPVLIGIWWFYSISQDVQRARAAVSRGAWEQAVRYLTNYLWWNPHDTDARLLIAEAYIKSEESGITDRVEKALFHLRQISDQSESAEIARRQEARLCLFLLKKPAAAETALQQSLRLREDSAESNLLMWQLLDLTGRHVLSDSYFWRAFELSSQSQRPQLLKSWFLSEFYPDQLYQALFQQMGIAASGNIPAPVSLLVHFRESEPRAAVPHAALADYYKNLGNLKGAMDLLGECPDSSAAMHDAFFVSVLFEALIDLGESEKAKECFHDFPQPHSGYLFRKCEGLYYDDVERNPKAAEVSMRYALETGPGKFDWGLMNRLSVVLTKNGQSDEAKLWQARVDMLTREVLTVENTSRLRNLLQAPPTLETAENLADFYEKLGLRREVSAWNDYKSFMTSTNSPGTSDVQVP